MVEFFKMHGAGNDFVVFDARTPLPPELMSPEGMRWLCDRRYGVGADQVLLLENSDRLGVDFRYRIFNADGHEVAQCGNGARCFAQFVFERGLAQGPVIAVETASGVIYPRRLESGILEVDLGPPRLDPSALPMDVAGLAADGQGLYAPEDPAGLAQAAGLERFFPVSMGNPHLVAFGPVESPHLADVGAWLQAHPRLPESVNVGLAEVVDQHRIRLRVFERGSGETLACGTGACAAVVAGIATGRLASPVTVEARGGTLQVRWSGSPTDSVFLAGPAQTVFEGRLSLDRLRAALRATPGAGTASGSERTP